MYIKFPFKELFMPLFKHAAYMFCFSIASSHVSISICKNFAMFLCAIKDLQQNYFFILKLYFIILRQMYFATK